MGIVFNVQKFCLHDGDGIRTCVFLKGCPLNCIWCHNPEGLSKASVLSFSSDKCSACGKCLSVCSARKIENSCLVLDREKCVACGKCEQVCLNGANELTGKEMSASEVFDEVLKDKIFYETSGGGLTVTGGEPSYQEDFTLELLALAKNEGINAAIETCGMGSRTFYEKTAKLGATFLFDIKCIDSTLHKSLTGADNYQILSNLEHLMKLNADIIIRIPLIPDCNDSDVAIGLLADFLIKNKNRYRYAEIMPYHSLGTSKRKKLGASNIYEHNDATDEEIARWCALFKANGIDIAVSK